jgi:cytochrome c5
MSGVAGAPKFGDADAWAPRIAKGKEALYASTYNGLNIMPPRGTCSACSDEDLRNTVDYMVSAAQ